MEQRNRSINVQEHILRDGSMSSEMQDFLNKAAAEMKKNTADHK